MGKIVAVIPGEDAAPEAMEPSVALLSRMGLDIEWTYPEVGAAATRNCGNSFPERARAEIDRVYAEGRTLTPDHGGVASSEDFCRAVGAAL